MYFNCSFSHLQTIAFSMAYNQQQQQPQQQQQYVLTGQMVNIDGQQVLQQPQYVTINQPAMAAATIGKSSMSFILIRI